jgi:plasmid stabilization system protein ParE
MGENIRVVLRERARHDVEAAVDWYREEADEDTALRFVNALEAALAHVGPYPTSGSARYSLELGIPGLDAGSANGSPTWRSTSHEPTTSMCGVCCTVIATSQRGCMTRTSRPPAVKPAPISYGSEPRIPALFDR